MLLHVFVSGLACPLGGLLFRSGMLDGALDPFTGRTTLRLAGAAALVAEAVFGRRPTVHPGFLDLRAIIHPARGVFLSVLGIFGQVRTDGAVNLVGCEPVKSRPAASLCLRRAHGVYLPW